MSREFYRISRLPPYVFAEVNTIKARARAEGRDVIDFGMGNPDSPTPQHIVDKLIETAKDGTAHGYSISQGIKGLRKALAAYYDRRFNVQLDPDKEVVCTIGSKEGLASLAKAITRPGDVIIVPNPSYPIHPYGFILSEAAVWYLAKDLNSPEPFDLMKELKRAVRDCNPKPSVLVLNYPCNPTTETATLEFYEEVVEFCIEHNIWIISDLAYCEIYFDGKPPPSILQTKRGREIAIEFTTLSKTYSMAGWRVGFAAGNPELVGALKKIKSYLDYGTFTPIQVAATAALNGPQDCVATTRELYKNRMEVLVEGMHTAGWMVEKPKASMFVWAPIPEKYRHLGSLEFSKMLLNEAEIAVSPGIGFGQYGDTHVRFAMIENRQRTRQAMRNLKEFMKK